MHHQDPTPPTALSAAIAAWNFKAREASAPVLKHLSSSLRALQQLRTVLRHYGELAPELFERDNGIQTEYRNDPVPRLRELCARVDEFEEELAQLSRQTQAVGASGEALIRDYLLLLKREESASDLGGHDNFQLRLANWAEDGQGGQRYGDAQLLDKLIEAQKSEIFALNQHLAELEQSLDSQGSDRQTEFPRTYGQVEIQSVESFLQGSPISSIPVNASYYERILEAANAPEGHKVPMGAILTGAGVISERQLHSALDYQQGGRRQALGTLLVDLGYTTEDAIAQALAAQLALPYVVLGQEKIQRDAVAAIPVHLARRHACFPISRNDHALYVAMANPLDLIALEDLHIASSRHIRPCVASRGEIAEQINSHYTRPVPGVLSRIGALTVSRSLSIIHSGQVARCQLPTMEGSSLVEYQ